MTAMSVSQQMVYPVKLRTRCTVKSHCNTNVVPLTDFQHCRGSAPNKAGYHSQLGTFYLKLGVKIFHLLIKAQIITSSQG